MKRILIFFLIYHSTYLMACDPNMFSLKFDCLSSYVSINSADALNLTSNITVEAWIKATSWAVTSTEGSIICKHGWSQGEKGYVLRAGGNGELAFNIARLNLNGTYIGWKEVKSSPGALQLNKWHHVAGTYDGKKLKIYIDGLLVKSVNAKGSIVPSPEYDLRIGKIAEDSAENKRYWCGLIDEVRIWNVARTEIEINNDKDHQLSAGTLNLVGYWQFNEGTGTNSSDAVNGTLPATLVESNWNTDVPFTNGVSKPIITLQNGQLISPSMTGNQWNLNGVPLTGQTNQVYIPLQQGEYSLTIDYGLGCLATSEAVFYSTVGISKIETQNIKCKVNDGVLIFIDIPSFWEKGVFTLNDMIGKIVVTGTISSKQVDLSGFSPGLYFVIFTTGQLVYSMRIFVN